MGVAEDIADIEHELAKTQYNKATEGHIGRLKAKLARLKEQQASKAKIGSARSLGYGIRKAGDATVVFVGYPSVGKSTLLNALTAAHSKVAAYDFTTLTVVPGLMHYNGARIQLLDVPGLVEEAAAGRGRGREVLSVVRSADLVVLLLAPGRKEPIAVQEAVLKHELAQGGLRCNQRPPHIKVVEKAGGGIKLNLAVKLTKVSEAGIREVLKEFKFHNGEVIVREDVTQDQIIDALMGNRLYRPLLTVVNKADLLTEADRKQLPQDAFVISAQERFNLDQLLERVWERLGLVRIYLKEAGKPASKDPLILPAPATIRGVCAKIHQRWLKLFEYARVWGSTKVAGERVGIEFPLQDGDTVELHD